MFQVGEHQLLVLLLMVQPELDELLHLRGERPGQERLHGIVHSGPVGPDLLHGGAGEISTAGPTVPLSGLYVVGVEQEGVALVVQAIAGEVGNEDEGLEEPGRVREVPLRRAHVGHGLDHLILRGEAPGQVPTLLADGAVTLQEPTGSGSLFRESGFFVSRRYGARVHSRLLGSV